MLQTMIEELTTAFRRGLLKWKPSSLEIFPCGTLKGEVQETRIDQDGAELHYRHVQHMALLADMLDDCGSANIALTPRLGQADSLFFKHVREFQCRGPIFPRFRAWHGSPVASAIFGCASWHLFAHILRSLRTWELQRLRRMFKLRRKPSKSQANFNSRSAASIAQWFRNASLDMAFHRVLKFVYKAAWNEKTSPCDYNHRPLGQAREFCSAEWWEAVRFFPEHVCRQEALLHAHRGD